MGAAAACRQLARGDAALLVDGRRRGEREPVQRPHGERCRRCRQHTAAAGGGGEVTTIGIARSEGQAHVRAAPCGGGQRERLLQRGDVDARVGRTAALAPRVVARLWDRVRVRVRVSGGGEGEG